MNRAYLAECIFTSLIARDKGESPISRRKERNTFQEKKRLINEKLSRINKFCYEYDSFFSWKSDRSKKFIADVDQIRWKYQGEQLVTEFEKRAIDFQKEALKEARREKPNIKLEQISRIFELLKKYRLSLDDFGVQVNFKEKEDLENNGISVTTTGNLESVPDNSKLKSQQSKDNRVGSQTCSSGKFFEPKRLIANIDHQDLNERDLDIGCGL